MFTHISLLPLSAAHIMVKRSLEEMGQESNKSNDEKDDPMVSLISSRRVGQLVDRFRSISLIYGTLAVRQILAELSCLPPYRSNNMISYSQSMFYFSPGC